MNSYVLSVRNVVQEQRLEKFGSDFAKPLYLSVPWSSSNGTIPRDEPLPSHAMSDKQTWMEAIVEDAKAGSGSGQEWAVLLFVHGYNTDSTEALIRQRWVERNLHERGCPCIVIGFDWPTAGAAVAYLYDRHEATEAALKLVSGAIFPFALFSTRECPIKVHVLAHSMGGYVVREAFLNSDKCRMAKIPNDWSIGQLVFLGADVSSNSFVIGGDMDKALAHCGRFTNYFSGYDEALAVSNVKNLDISSRVGRVGMPSNQATSQKTVDVDCGPRYKAINPRKFKIIDGMVSHSWYLEDEIWLDDLSWTIRGDTDRALIPTRKSAGNGLMDDFVLKSEKS